MKKTVAFIIIIIICLVSFMFLGLKGGMYRVRTTTSETLAHDAAFLLTRARNAESFEYEKYKLSYFHKIYDKMLGNILNPTLWSLFDDGKNIRLRFSNVSAKSIVINQAGGQYVLTIKEPSLELCLSAIGIPLAYDQYNIELRLNTEVIYLPTMNDRRKEYLDMDVVNGRKTIAEKICETNSSVSLHFVKHFTSP